MFLQCSALSKLCLYHFRFETLTSLQGHKKLLQKLRKKEWLIWVQSELANGRVGVGMWEWVWQTQAGQLQWWWDEGREGAGSCTQPLLVPGNHFGRKMNRTRRHGEDLRELWRGGGDEGETKIAKNGKIVIRNKSFDPLNTWGTWIFYNIWLKSRSIQVCTVQKHKIVYFCFSYTYPQ